MLICGSYTSKKNNQLNIDPDTILQVNKIHIEKFINHSLENLNHPK